MPLRMGISGPAEIRDVRHVERKLSAQPFLLATEAGKLRDTPNIHPSTHLEATHVRGGKHTHPTSCARTSRPPAECYRIVTSPLTSRP